MDPNSAGRYQGFCPIKISKRLNSRFVDDQNIAIGQQPSSDADLLLVATAEIRRQIGKTTRAHGKLELLVGSSSRITVARAARARAIWMSCL
jgi:hypothetical protein